MLQLITFASIRSECVLFLSIARFLLAWSISILFDRRNVCCLPSLRSQCERSFRFMLTRSSQCDSKKHSWGTGLAANSFSHWQYYVAIYTQTYTHTHTVECTRDWNMTANGDNGGSYRGAPPTKPTFKETTESIKSSDNANRSFAWTMTCRCNRLDNRP